LTLAACGSGTSQSSATTQPSPATTQPTPASLLAAWDRPSPATVSSATGQSATVAPTNPTAIEQLGGWPANVGGTDFGTPIPSSAKNCEYVYKGNGTFNVAVIPDSDGSWYMQTARFLISSGTTFTAVASTGSGVNCTDELKLESDPGAGAPTGVRFGFDGSHRFNRNNHHPSSSSAGASYFASLKYLDGAVTGHPVKARPAIQVVPRKRASGVAGQQSDWPIVLPTGSPPEGPVRLSKPTVEWVGRLPIRPVRCP
jgi:hypothetical protein